MPPQAVAEQAVARAAQQVAPGIRVGGQAGPQGETEYEEGQSWDAGYGAYGSTRPYSGRWIRRGRRIILFGAY
jgi:hypothetical protein